MNLSSEPVVCETCSESVKRTSNRQRWCVECSTINIAKRQSSYLKHYYMNTTKPLSYSGAVKSMCEFCGDTWKLIVHHIDKDLSNNTLDNLATLCNRCHHLVHEEEKARNCRGIFIKKE